MAKKFKQLWFGRLNLDESILYLYKTGITQSCIIHTAMLLLLSCFIGNIDKPIRPICITFAEPQPEIDYVQADEQLIEVMPPESTEQRDELSEFIKESIVSENIEITESEEILAESEILNPMPDFNLEHLSQNVVTEKLDKAKPTRMGHRYTSNIQNNKQKQEAGLGESASIENGSDLAEMGRRLEEHGAQTGDIQVSLSWNSIDDIDLHVMVMPIRSQINWTNKRSACGGMLDIDMNAYPQMVSNRPVENVFWPNQKAPRGIYIVGVHNYMPWSRRFNTEVLVVVKVKGKIIKSQKIVVRYGEGVREVFRFNF